MDDEVRLEPPAGRQLRVAGVAAAEPAAGGEDLRPPGAMDRAVDSASPEERGVGGIDDRVRCLLGDVTLHEVYLHAGSVGGRSSSSSSSGSNGAGSGGGGCWVVGGCCGTSPSPPSSGSTGMSRTGP